MELGDKVIDGSGLNGRVVAILDRADFDPACPAGEWQYLLHGILVETEEAGLVHYENVDDLLFLEDPK